MCRKVNVDITFPCGYNMFSEQRRVEETDRSSVCSAGFAFVVLRFWQSGEFSAAPYRQLITDHAGSPGLGKVVQTAAWCTGIFDNIS